MDANIIPPLIHLLGNAEFDIRKEAAWAISNATSGGSPEQIKFLVQQGCVPPLAELLNVQDPKIIIVALEGLENILKIGDAEAKHMGTDNMMVQIVEQSNGAANIEQLQHHENEDIYNKAVRILEQYFNVEEEDPGMAPQQMAGGQGYAFQPQAPMGGGGFNFGQPMG